VSTLRAVRVTNATLEELGRLLHESQGGERASAREWLREEGIEAIDADSEGKR
jgi:hypothetical protein